MDFMVCKLFLNASVGRGEGRGWGEAAVDVAAAKKEDKHNCDGKKQKWSIWVVKIGYPHWLAGVEGYLFLTVKCLRGIYNC